jgi:hypothetical protein
MPFGGCLDDYYQDIYCPAIASAGLEPHRADDLFRPSTIVTDIWVYTKRARLILADLSGKNPNVFYELGLAHALAKPAILVTESMDDVPFDLRALRVLVYDKNAQDWGAILRAKVKTAINEVLQAPAESVLPAFLDTKGAGPKPTLTPQEKEVVELRQKVDLLEDTVRMPDRIRGKIEDIGPSAARVLIRQYVKEGMPEGIIIRRLAPLGPPVSWIKREIDVLRRGKRRNSKKSA